MTKKEIEQLADLIVEKIAAKQKELDKEFIEGLENSGANVEVHVISTKIEKLELEIFKLQDVLKFYETHERYEEAVSCRNYIQELTDEIENLKKQ